VCSVRPGVVTLPDGEERFEFGRAECVDDLDRFDGFSLQGLDDIDMRHLCIRVSLHATEFLHTCVFCGVRPLSSFTLSPHLPTIYTTLVHQQVHRGVVAYWSCGVGEMGEGEYLAACRRRWRQASRVHQSRNDGPTPIRRASHLLYTWYTRMEAERSTRQIPGSLTGAGVLRQAI
jgi:hypothetical protein